MAANHSYENSYTEEAIQKIAIEFSRLNGLVYLDHTGSTLYADSQINAVFEDLRRSTYGNPHSMSFCSKICQDSIDLIRYRILRHFHTNSDEYSVVFTSGATSALKLLIETFDFVGSSIKHEASDGVKFTSAGITDGKNEYCDSLAENKRGKFVYLNENHTSVIGMREVALNKGASVGCISVTEMQECCSTYTPPELPSTTSRNSLFAYPAQCNFSGMKYPLTWIESVQGGIMNSFDHNNPSNWFCLLDAATFASTNELNLSEIKPDFVCISFYKIFGYPTGLGALLIRNSIGYVLKKEYFGGGSVSISLSNIRFHVPKSGFERFEDGTIPFLSILSIQHGFDTLYRLVGSMSKVTSHTFSLAQYFYHNLITMHHDNGNPVAQVYCDTNYDDMKTQGNIVNFNLLRADGKYIGYAKVLHMANLHNIHIRTGCFCNPGACQRHLGLEDRELLDNFEAGHVCGDSIDLINGKPTGSVRVSFGYMSTKSDADCMLGMIESCFKEKLDNLFCGLSTPCEGFKKMARRFTEKKLQPNITLPATMIHDIERLKIKKHLHANKETCCILSHIFLYPVKSCGAYQVKRWALGSRGLLYDRQWMVVNSAGVCLTQKREPRLCMIRPSIDLNNELLHLSYPGMQAITIPLNVDNTEVTSTSTACQSKVCGDKVQVIDCGDAVGKWLTSAFSDSSLGNLRLYSQSIHDARESFRSSKNFKFVKSNVEERRKDLALSNQAQFLLINSASVKWLLEKIDKEVEGSSLKEDDLLSRFRSNFVVEDLEAFSENTWNTVKIGDITFQSEGPCTRCQMVCIDQTTGKKTKEPLITISRAFDGKIKFGIYLSQIDLAQTQNYISVGDVAKCTEKN